MELRLLQQLGELRVAGLEAQMALEKENSRLAILVESNAKEAAERLLRVAVEHREQLRKVVHGLSARNKRSWKCLKLWKCGGRADFVLGPSIEGLDE